MYCSLAQVRAAGSQITVNSTPSISDAHLTDLIERASRFFDLVCGVEPEHFEPAGATATERTFYGDGTHYLKLDPYVAGTLDATISLPEAYTVPDFVERGGFLIITDSNGVLPPFRYFYNCCYTGWYSGVAITVTAKWGYEDTPADVQLAVIELTINLLRETDPASLKLISIDNQPLRETLPPRVREIARRYRVIDPVFI